jgi:hypothetical protein
MEFIFFLSAAFSLFISFLGLRLLIIFLYLVA